MVALSVILDILLVLISLGLIVAVLMQEGQKQGLGAIAGGADTFFGKGKAKGIDAKLAKITKIAAVIFIVLAIAATIVVSHAYGMSDETAAPEGEIELIEGEEAAEGEEIVEGEAAEEGEETETAPEEAEAPAEEAAPEQAEEPETAEAADAE